MNTAKGTFEITMTPQNDEGFEAGRLTLDKTYSGDLEATAKGQMLSHRSAVEGSAGYVAIEAVSGTLAGKNGSFHLMHSGTMVGGKPSLSVIVVPDSGTDELVGLSGTLDIIIGADGSHAYEFEYEV